MRKKGHIILLYLKAIMRWSVIKTMLVDKSRQRMILYTYNAHWQETTQWPCSTGKNDGPKQVEGDGKTPEGIYFATRNVTQPYISARYGSRALPLDYPSRIDRHHRRGGSAIWLHGTNRPLMANNSNGCVVLQNEHIEQVAQYVELKRTPIIIVDRLRSQARNNSTGLRRIWVRLRRYIHRCISGYVPVDVTP